MVFHSPDTIAMQTQSNGPDGAIKKNVENKPRPAILRRKKIMSNKNVVPEARESLNRFKMQAASEVGVNLKEGYNGDLTSRQAGSVGGQMVKKMIESYEQNMK